MNPRQRDELLLGLLDGVLEKEAAQRLETLIIDDPKVVDRLVELSLLECHLRWPESDMAPSEPDRDIPPVLAEDIYQMAATDLNQHLTSQAPRDVSEIRRRAEKQLNAFLAEERRLREAARQLELSARRRQFHLADSIRSMASRVETVVTCGVKTTVRVAALAAVVFLVLGLVRYIQAWRVVAILDRTLEAQWTRAPERAELGRGWLQLERGYAQMTLKQGAQVLVQAPCEFKLVSPNKIELATGSLTAVVPPSAQGFVVDTPSAHIVDHGTAFGVAVNGKRDSEIHVFRGEVGYRSPLRSATDALEPLPHGQAAQMNMEGDIQISSLDGRPSLFIQQLPDANPLGMPGVRFNLADVIGGGNGFGTGVRGGAEDGPGTYNSLTGRLGDPWRPGEAYQRFGGHVVQPMRYVRCVDHPYIDGSCLPDSSQGECVVSSMGHVFAECPDTDGQLTWNVCNGWRYADDPNAWKQTPELNAATCISLHANNLVTFDLDAIRLAMPGVEVVAFSAEACAPSIAAKSSDRDLWVLVDGEPRFQARDARAGYRALVHFALRPEDRFLTLAVTDSQTAMGRWSSNDWSCFLTPHLELAPVSKKGAPK